MEIPPVFISVNSNLNIGNNWPNGKALSFDLKTIGSNPILLLEN